MDEYERLMKLIDGHLEILRPTCDPRYYQGMANVRWIVYSFFNAPRPIKEPSPLTEEELKMLTPEEENDQ